MDRRKGIIAGYLKLGPTGKVVFWISVVGIILSLAFGIYAVFSGATKGKQDEIMGILNDENSPRSSVVKKTLQERTAELRQSINFVKEDLERAKLGEKVYLVRLSGQLRALVCHGRTLRPLLIDLAEVKGVRLVCYDDSAVIEMQLKLLPKLKLSINPGRVVSYKKEPGLGEGDFKKWIDAPYLFIGGEKYTPNEVIKAAAEKFGGAHYDEDVPERVKKLQEIIYGDNDYNEIQKILAQTAEVVVYLGEQVLDAK